MSLNVGGGTILFGGSGFMGSWILRNHPHIISASRTPPATPNPHIAIPDISDLQALDEVSFDRVIYLIGNSDHHGMARGDPNAFEQHVTPLLTTLEQLKNRTIRRFLQFSTTLLYDENRITQPVSETAPINPYKTQYILSQHFAEEICRFYSPLVPITSVRLAPVYGATKRKRFDLIGSLIGQLLERGEAEVWTTRPERDFIYVEDAADAIVQLLEADYTGVVNLGTGTLTAVSRIVELLRELSGCTIRDLDLAVTGPMRLQCDLSLLQSLIDWAPRYSIEEGVRRAYQMSKALRTACASG